MNEPIRVLHFADTHIGMENYGKTDTESGLSTRVVDFLRRMDDIVEHARENEVDLVIFAGDAFKTRNPNPTFQREFAWRVRDLAALAPVVLLVGNHDLPPTLMKASSIEIYDTLAVPNVWVANDYETRLVQTRRGAVIVGTAPYPIRSRLLQDNNTMGMTISQTDALLHQQMTRILDELAQQADALDPEGTTPRLLTAHFTVSGALWGSERSVMVGRDVAIDLSALADPRWDYVALGHIHKHQNLTHNRQDVPPVVYSGSIERIDFGEEGDPKGFCWVRLARRATTWDFIPLAVRHFITLRADCRKSANPTQDVLKLINKHKLSEAVVRLFIQLTPETQADVKENAIVEALKRAGVFHIATIRKDVEQAARIRLGGNPEGMTSLQLLERYLISREMSEERRAELLAAAQKLIAELDGE